MTITGGLFQNNRSVTQSGGGLRTFHATSITGGVFQDNQAPNSVGGGLEAERFGGGPIARRSADLKVRAGISADETAHAGQNMNVRTRRNLQLQWGSEEMKHGVAWELTLPWPPQVPGLAGVKKPGWTLPHTEPWYSFDPDLVTIASSPPPNRPYSALKLLRTSLNSLIASTGG